MEFVDIEKVNGSRYVLEIFLVDMQTFVGRWYQLENIWVHVCVCHQDTD